jgi:hypothetical protein
MVVKAIEIFIKSIDYQLLLIAGCASSNLHGIITTYNLNDDFFQSKKYLLYSLQKCFFGKRAHA